MKGFLAAASFGTFSRQKTRKVHPKRIDLAETSFQPYPNKNSLPRFPHQNRQDLNDLLHRLDRDKQLRKYRARPAGSGARQVGHRHVPASAAGTDRRAVHDGQQGKPDPNRPYRSFV